MPQLICVVGPTATGKTKMGVALAKYFDGEVVSADSMQIYRGMEIGTAAPTKEEQEGIPHHMIGIADPAESWSVAKYVSAADACIQDILSRGKMPVLVGGTGLWLDALVRGNEFAKGAQGEETRLILQKRLKEEGIEALFSELRRVDPVSAESLHLRDEKRILRALEVFLLTGEPISTHNAKTRARTAKYNAYYIGLNYASREDLREKINTRVDSMVAQGLENEVERLLDGGRPQDATSLQAIGYKQFLTVREGKAVPEEAIEEIKLRSRQYAKRQLTWLRRNEQIHWILWDKTPDFSAGFREAVDYLESCGLEMKPKQ